MFKTARLKPWSLVLPPPAPSPSALVTEISALLVACVGVRVATKVPYAVLPAAATLAPSSPIAPATRRRSRLRWLRPLPRLRADILLLVDARPGPAGARERRRGNCRQRRYRRPGGRLHSVAADSAKGHEEWPVGTGYVTVLSDPVRAGAATPSRSGGTRPRC